MNYSFSAASASPRAKLLIRLAALDAVTQVHAETRSSRRAMPSTQTPSSVVSAPPRARLFIQLDPPAPSLLMVGLGYQAEQCAGQFTVTMATWRLHRRIQLDGQFTSAICMTLMLVVVTWLIGVLVRLLSAWPN